MEINREELFESALNDAPVNDADTTAVEQPAGGGGERARDENGRFAPNAQDDQAQASPAGQQQPNGQDGPEGMVPSYRVREQTQRAEAAERRLQDREAFFMQQFQAMQQRIAPPQPTQQQEQPDWFVDPDARLQQGVRQAIDPIQQRIAAITETFSRRDAEREHGRENVDAAYQAMDQALRMRDPEAVSAYQRAMNSAHPFGDIVSWHQQKTVYSQIGNDPQAWFQKQMDERLAKDPQFAAAVMQKIQQGARGNSQNGQGGNIQLPPSLSRVSSAQGGGDDGDDGPEAAFRYALS